MKSSSILLAAVFVLISGHAAGQTYPVKPVRMLVGFPGGSTTDIIARTYSAKLTELLGRQVVVENRAGAGANIAAEAAAKSAPDGYTTLLGSPGLAVSPALYSRLGYDALRDLAGVGQVSATPHIVVVNQSLPVKTLQELIALARARPGQLNFSSAGAGGSDHLGTELFSSMAGLKMVHVPYKGGPQAITDVIAGEVAMYFAAMPVGLPLYKAGKVKALAVSSAQRLAFLPELPTVAQSGLPGFEHTLWSALLVPAGTPREIVMRLNADIARAANTPELRERLNTLGAEVVVTSPEQFSAFLKSETEKYGRVVRALGLKAD
jgi:tripartite-type tricarboxylate transporter receptor subunit TctC